MRTKLLLLTVFAFITAFILAFRTQQKYFTTSVVSFNEFKKREVVRCGVDWESLRYWFEETDIPPIPGAGNYKWVINTKNDSAQFYFNQGINMYYCFHIIEAMASFKKAAKLDPDCAMLEWAQALAYGPNINDVGYAASPDALMAISKAVKLSTKNNEKEKMLIQAQRLRYSDDSTISREKLNQLYVNKMREVYQKYPNDADVAALYADALMLQHPWDLWYNNGTPKPWTPLIRNVLEKLLAKSPNHPGANHYYIHVMEASPFAAKAIPSADRLGKLTPGLSHTVHMPSHIYLRTGNYSKGTVVNENAISSFKKVISLYAPATGNDFLYVIHNLHMQTNHAMLAGRLDYSVKTAIETVNSVPKDYLSSPAPLGNYMQYIYMTPILVDVRFGRWNELLSRQQPGATQVYANVLYHFGRGLAYSRQQNFKEASNELDQMRECMKDSSLNIPMSPFSSALDGARVAEEILLGVIHEDRKLYEGAIRHFKRADSIEINMVYNEPRDWLLNPKHYLGNVYLLTREWKKAEDVLRKDLLVNNENGWALTGLYKALLAQKRLTEAMQVLTRAKKAFSQSDIKITGPVF